VKIEPDDIVESELNPWDKISEILDQYILESTTKHELGSASDDPSNNFVQPQEKQVSKAIATYLSIMEQYQSVGLCTEIVSSNDTDCLRQHQTVVFAWAAGVDNEQSRERMVRFVTSLNTNETIKADILTVRGDGQFVRGLSFDGTKVPRTAAQMKLLDKLVNKLGWVQSIMLFPTNDT
jgi:hypothetical protein